MMSTLKMFAALAVLCMAAFGLLLAFGVLTVETVTENGIQVLGGIGVLLVTAVALKAIAGRGNSGETDPPPTL